jgi:hypothetical protein
MVNLRQNQIQIPETSKFTSLIETKKAENDLVSLHNKHVLYQGSQINKLGKAYGPSFFRDLKTQPHIHQQPSPYLYQNREMYQKTPSPYHKFSRDI